MDMPTSHEIDRILIFFIDSLSLAVFREQKRRLLQVRPARNAGPDVRAFHYEGRTPFCGPVLFAEQAIWRQMFATARHAGWNPRYLNDQA